MILIYLRAVFRYAFAASWRALNGIVGSFISGIATLLLGPWTVVVAGDRGATIINYAVPFVVYALVAFTVWFLVQAIFVAPFAIWGRDRTTKGRPLEILFDNKEPSHVRPKLGLYGPEAEFYSIAINNPNDASRYDVVVRILDSWFTRTIISEAWSHISKGSHDPLPILKRESLHPGCA